MTDLNPESIAALLELEAKAFDGTWEVSPHFDKKLRQRDLIRKVPGGADVILGTISDYEDASLIAAARNLIRPLAEAYLAGLDASDRARVEELEGMREWCLVGKNPVFSDYDAGHNNTLQSVIFELDRRIAAIKERKS